MRNPEKYVVNISKSERHKRSAVPFLQRLLNEDYLKQKKDFKKLLQVNNGVCYNTTRQSILGSDGMMKSDCSLSI